MRGVCVVAQGPSSSAYVTYLKPEDALRAIQHVNNLVVDGRTLKASLGTTKYCSFYLKHHQCLKTDCMYLHEIGDEAASFTKEEMQHGKHLEYEKKLHEQMLQNEKANMDQQQSTELSPTLIPTTTTEGFPSHKKPQTKATPSVSSSCSSTERKASYTKSRKGKKEPHAPRSSSESSSQPSERTKSREKQPANHISTKPVAVGQQQQQPETVGRPPSSDPVELSHRSQESSPSSGSPFLTPIGSLTDRPVTPPSIYTPPQHQPLCPTEWSYPPTENHFMPPLLPSQLEKEDELGFDPCEESTKALAEIVEKEAAMNKEIQRNGPFIAPSTLVGSLENPLLYNSTENGPVPQRPMPNPPPGFTTAPMNGLIHSTSLFKDHYSGLPRQPQQQQPAPQYPGPNHLMTTTARQQEELRKMLPNIKISFGPTVPQMLPRSKGSMCPPDVFRVGQQEPSPAVAPSPWLPPRQHHPDSLLKLQQLHLEESKSWASFPQQLPPPGFSYKYPTDTRNGVQNSIEGGTQPAPPPPYFYPILERHYSNQ